MSQRFLSCCLAAVAGFALTPGPDATVPVQLLTPVQDAHYRSMVPTSPDGRLRGLADDPRTTFYDEDAMPRLYQGVVDIPGWHDAYHNISAAQPLEPFGNPNREFPWNRSAGLTKGDNAVSFKFFRLPPDGKVSWWSERWHPYGTGQFADVLAWRFPVGTEFGNCKVVLGPNGRAKVFEVELRRRDEKGWAPAVYRPVHTAEEYRWEFPLMDEAGDTETGPVLLLSDDDHTRVVFRRKAVEDVLPQANLGDVDRLLAKPFRPVTKPWRTLADGAECAAPTTQADWQIVPKGYNGAWLKVGREECMTCHSGAGTLHANDSQPARDWYGYVRGSDGIFSLNLADPRLAPILQRVR